MVGICQTKEFWVSFTLERSKSLAEPTSITDTDTVFNCVLRQPPSNCHRLGQLQGQTQCYSMLLVDCKNSSKTNSVLSVKEASRCVATKCKY